MTRGCLLVAFAPDRATGNDDPTTSSFVEFRLRLICILRIPITCVHDCRFAIKES